MRRRRRLRVVDRVGVGLDRSAARGVDERDKAGDAEVYDLAGQGREWRGPYYVFDNLRNLAQIRRVISRRDDVRQRHCAGDISESDDRVLVEGHESLIPMLRPAGPNLTGIRKPHELGRAAYAAGRQVIAVPAINLEQILDAGA